MKTVTFEMELGEKTATFLTQFIYNGLLTAVSN
jgi:hypothetical protein